MTTDPFESRIAQRVAELQRANDELSSVNSIILRWDARGRVRWLNDFGLRLFGYRSEEIVGRSVLDTIVAPTDAQGFDLAKMIDDILVHPAEFAFNENENVCKDGTRLWIAWRNTPLFDEQGQLREILTVGVDITERKRAEEALEQARDQLDRALREQAAFIEALTDVFYVFDTSFRLMRWNSRLQLVTGYGADELAGRRFEELFATEEREIVARQQRALLGSDAAACFLAHLVTKDARRLPFEFNARRSEDAEGRAIGYVGTARDMTERLESEARDMEAARIAAIAKLVAGLFHELNTPLGVLNCGADVMNVCLGRVHELVAGVACQPPDRARMTALTEAMRASTAANRQAITRIRAVVSDLAAFVRLDAPPFGHFDLGQALDHTVRLVIGPGGEPIEIVRDYQDHQGVCGRHADLNQVFMKLLTEAVESLRGRGRLCLRTAADDGWALVQIEARSPHLPPASAPLLGEPGIQQRGDRMAAALGLFGAQHLVRQHRGELRVEADPQRGLVFTVRLPRGAGAVGTGLAAKGGLAEAQ